MENNKKEEEKSYCNLCKIKEDCYKLDKLEDEVDKDLKKYTKVEVIMFGVGTILTVVIGSILESKNILNKSDVILIGESLTMLACSAYFVPSNKRYQKILKEKDEQKIKLNSEMDKVIDSFEPTVELDNICDRIRRRIINTKNIKSITIIERD